MSIAVIKTGGKQYKVKEGDILNIEKLDNKKGDSVEFPDILGGKKVSAKVTDQIKGEKIRIFKYKNKSGYRKRQGHRQKLTKITVEKIG